MHFWPRTLTARGQPRSKTNTRRQIVLATLPVAETADPLPALRLMHAMGDLETGTRISGRNISIARLSCPLGSSLGAQRSVRVARTPWKQPWCSKTGAGCAQTLDASPRGLNSIHAATASRGTLQCGAQHSRSLTTCDPILRGFSRSHPRDWRIRENKVEPLREPRAPANHSFGPLHTVGNKTQVMCCGRAYSPEPNVEIADLHCCGRASLADRTPEAGQRRCGISIGDAFRRLTLAKACCFAEHATRPFQFALHANVWWYSVHRSCAGTCAPRAASRAALCNLRLGAPVVGPRVSGRAAGGRRNSSGLA